MKLPRLFGIALAGLALMIVPAACAQEGMECPCPLMQGGMGMMHQSPGMHMMMGMSPAAWILACQDRLNLNDSQVKQLTDQDTQFKMKMVDRKADLEKKMIKVRHGLRDETITKEQARPMLDEIAKGYEDMVIAWLDAKDQAKEVLTPEQRDMLKKMRWEMTPYSMPGMKAVPKKAEPAQPPKGAGQ